MDLISGSGRGRGGLPDSCTKKVGGGLEGALSADSTTGVN